MPVPTRYSAARRAFRVAAAFGPAADPPVVPAATVTLPLLPAVAPAAPASLFDRTQEDFQRRGLHTGLTQAFRAGIGSTVPADDDAS